MGPKFFKQLNTSRTEAVRVTWRELPRQQTDTAKRRLEVVTPRRRIPKSSGWQLSKFGGPLLTRPPGRRAFRTPLRRFVARYVLVVLKPS